MPSIDVAIFQDEDGKAPLFEWLNEIPEKAQDKCRVRIERLAEMGNELRRPEADYLDDGIYELRVRLHKVNYRILYFFAGKELAVLSHGITKEKRVPKKEIKRALANKRDFAVNQALHTHQDSE